MPEYHRLKFVGRNVYVDVAVPDSMFDAEMEVQHIGGNRGVQGIKRKQHELYDTDAMHLETTLALIFKNNPAFQAMEPRIALARPLRYVGGPHHADLIQRVTDMPANQTTPEAAPPSSHFVSMYPHQLQGLHFMLDRERNATFDSDMWLRFDTLDERHAYYSPIFHEIRCVRACVVLAHRCVPGASC